MNTRLDIRNRLKRELQMVSTSTIFSTDTLNDAINDANLWATSRHAFPEREKAKSTVTEAGQQYYDIPSEFESDSVFMVVIASELYEAIDYEDWVLQDDDSYTVASFGNQFFLKPVPVISDIELIVWGLIQAPPLDSDESQTIFSNREASLNEGIMRKALSDLLGSKGKRDAESNNELLKAQAIIDSGWQKIALRRNRSRRKDAPLFEVPDFFGD